jgi:hypothetical protein
MGKEETNILVKISAAAPTPMMHRTAAEAFERLRRIVRDGAGFDFLAKLGDALRPANFVSDKDGVANRSWHKTGRAFDYDQTSSQLVLVSEPRAGKQYFRTYLVCTDQTGKLGVKRSLRDIRGGSVNAYVFDFTAAAEKLGFKRIPAWSGWQRNYNRREFWHYQLDEGLTWTAAMAELQTDSKPNGKTYGLNARGPEVRRIQQKLFELGLLPAKEIDGVYGAKTFAAVKAFQKVKGLPSDGLVGPITAAEFDPKRS